ncbi:YciI family protein [Methylocella sp. CPCC 101449]|jgi:hypothetical protein|uniref:YciI family protein n=1 Tax=Methylocella sp. CPCC 101449 TaxID=2987531 RepID=UPI00288FB740|nr:YciI family protein [Methylocella sp. CPCC 101449]MDT2024469.1 YciI family protein [Methylocella sp. CPCC 101449]HEV2571029.1 YciI family protein [Beijerinckiaceae bacterium]
MLIVRLAYNAPGKDQERAQNLAAHSAHLRSGKAKLLQSGPIYAADGERVGALIVFDAKDFAEVEAFSAADPFVISGVYNDVRLARWEKTIG